MAIRPGFALMDIPSSSLASQRLRLGAVPIIPMDDAIYVDVAYVVKFVNIRGDILHVMNGNGFENNYVTFDEHIPKALKGCMLISIVYREFTLS